MIIKKAFIFLFFFLLLSLPVGFAPENTFALGTVTKVSTSSNDVINPVTVADSKGYLHSVWQELTPDQVWTGVNPGIYYSRWNGDTWSAPLKISANTDFASNPSIAVDSADTVHIVWDDSTYGGCADGNPPPCQQNAGLPLVAYKTRSSTGTWSAISTLPAPAGTIASRFARIAVNSVNEPNVFFTANTNGNQDSIYWSRFTAGAWTSPQLVSLNASGTNIIDSQWVDVKNDNAGNIHLVYWSFGQSLFYRKLTNNIFSTAFQVNTSGNMQSTRIGATPLGEVFITWYQNFDTSINVRWTVGGVWQDAIALTTSSQRSFWGYPIMGVTTDSKERAHVGWGEKDATDGLIDLKYRSFVAGTWQAAQDVDLNNNDADTPFVYPDKWDNQHFMWAERNPSTNLWELYYRVAEGTIQNVTTAGGTVTANPFNVTQATLTIPNGALASTQQIAIQVGPVPESVSPTQVTIPKAYTFRPNGLTFSTPATAKIFYTDAEVAGADENLLAPWIWDSQLATWTAQTVVSRNITANTMDVSLTHFSLYGISAPRIVVNWLKPSSEVRGNKIKYVFSMNYADNTPFRALTRSDKLNVVLKNSNGDVIATDKNVKLKKGVFEGKIKVKTPGNYSLEVYLNGSLMDIRNVTVIQSKNDNNEEDSEE